jgi:predicted Zn-ribbon and HTH transcriptional regulator
MAKKLTDIELQTLPLCRQSEILRHRERRERNKEFYAKQRKLKRIAKRLQLCDILGSRVCVRCGYSDVRALQFDHINGNGRKSLIQDFKQPSLRDKILNYYIMNPELAKKTFQVLCANCNWIKRHDKNEMT